MSVYLWGVACADVSLSVGWRVLMSVYLWGWWRVLMSVYLWGVACADVSLPVGGGVC